MKDFLLSDKAEMVIAVTMNEGEHEKNSWENARILKICCGENSHMDWLGKSVQGTRKNVHILEDNINFQHS
jgi:hypothetical protein